MVYSWDDKEETCRRMWVDEKRSLNEIVQFFEEQVGFVPSKRAFQVAFKRWGFPSKQKPAHKNPELMARTKEMWEKNMMQKDMVAALREEGFDVNDRDIVRLRNKLGLLLRMANGSNQALSDQDSSQLADENSLLLDPSASQPNMLADHALAHSPKIDDNLATAYASGGETSEVLGSRKRKIDHVRAESDRKYQWRKRRRRTLDASGSSNLPSEPPRYPSETTLAESQAYLKMDNARYIEAREQFRALCLEKDVIRKSVCGPEKWQAIKDDLIRENPHLLHVFQQADQSELATLQLCLDVLCQDVTKGIRNMSRAMTLAEAKNILGVNPDEARSLRTHLISILKANGFVSSTESGNWEELKQKFIRDAGLSQRVPPVEGPEREKGLRALNMLCRDIMKRWRDQQTHRDPNKTKKARGLADAEEVAQVSQWRLSDPSRAREEAPTGDLTHQQDPRSSGPIDPSLLLAVNDTQGVRTDALPATYPLPNQPTSSTIPQPIAAYFRLNPESPVHGVPRIWLGALADQSVSSLWAAALSFPNAGAFAVAKIEGLVTGVNGMDMMFQIDQDDEMEGYLNHVGTGKATFSVLLRQTYA